MSDKAERSHIERQVWINYPIGPGGSIRYGEWETNEAYARRCRECYGSGKVSDQSWRDVRCSVCRGSGNVKPLELTLIDYATGSDYSGTLVEHSNYRTLKAEFPWLVEVHGGHGTFGLAYLGKRENQNAALIEAIDSLTDYCIFDDSDHSNLECEREIEAWSEAHGGEYDFRKALASYFDEIDEDHEHDYDLLTNDLIEACSFPKKYYPDPMSSVWELWREGCEVFNVNGGSGYLNEQGDQIYFCIDEWIDSARKPNYPTWSEDNKRSCDALIADLHILADKCRTKESASDQS